MREALSVFVARIRGLFRSRRLDRDFREEIESHLRMAEDDAVRRGTRHDEAQRQARIELGGVAQLRESVREAHGLPWVGALAYDARQAFRGLARSRKFALTAVATLAVGIGVNAAVFTVTDTVLYRGFPLVRENDRVLYITTFDPGCCVSMPDFEDWRQASSFDQMAVIRGLYRPLIGADGFQDVRLAYQVSPNAFDLLGVRPILGRDFLPSDSQPGAPAVAILNHGFWQRRFGGDPAILGQSISIGGDPTTVIGVMPPRFSFPETPALWTALIPDADLRRRDARELWFAFGRLAEGATVEGARAEIEAIGRRLGEEYPATNEGRNLVPYVQTFEGFFTGPERSTTHKAMWGAVGLVLLIACANVANLLLGRAVGRSQDVRIRTALGAPRWRIIGQLLLEGLMLATAGGIAGWWIARAGVRLYALSGLGGWATDTLGYTMDARVLVYLVSISAAAALLFSVAPAFRLCRSRVLTDANRHVTGGRRRKRLSLAIVTAEMTLAVVLLSGAGLLTRSFLTVQTSDVGVKSSDVLMASVALATSTYSTAEDQMAFFDRLKDRLTGIPGVESVAFSRSVPTGAARLQPYGLTDESTDPGSLPMVGRVIVSPDYFRTLGASVLSGRTFNSTDGSPEAPVAIVNERFESRHWPEDTALGKRVRLFAGDTPGPWFEVIGVVSNIVQNDATRQAFEPLIYLPYRYVPERLPDFSGVTFFLHTSVSPLSLADELRATAKALDPDVPVSGVMNLTDNLNRDPRTRGALSGLFLTFAAIALLFASLGLYAVVAQFVAERRREIGVRTAMGATESDIRNFVLRTGLWPLATGLGIGLPASFALNRILGSWLVGVSPGDPLTLLITSAVLVVSAVLGCLVPARRAMRVNPAVVLRSY